MKVFNLIFSLLFTASAVLQYNDPDPYLWMPIYLFAAILCWLAFRNKFYPKVYLTGITLYLGYAVYLFTTGEGVLDWLAKHDAENIAQSMKADKPWIEAAREFLGLMIIIAVLLVNYFYARRKYRNL